MNRIVTYISDPAWWFTAVFVAVLASLAAAFLKDALLSGLAKVSTHFNIRKQKRDEEIEKDIDEALSDHTLLILTVAKAILIGVDLLIIVMACFISTTIFMLIPSDVTGVKLFVKIIYCIIAMVTGFGIWFLVFRQEQRVDVVWGAYQRYRKKFLIEKDKHAHIAGEKIDEPGN